LSESGGRQLIPKLSIAFVNPATVWQSAVISTGSPLTCFMADVLIGKPKEKEEKKRLRMGRYLRMASDWKQLATGRNS